MKHKHDGFYVFSAKQRDETEIQRIQTHIHTDTRVILHKAKPNRKKREPNKKYAFYIWFGSCLGPFYFCSLLGFFYRPLSAVQ